MVNQSLRTSSQATSKKKELSQNKGEQRVNSQLNRTPPRTSTCSTVVPVI